MNAIASNSPTSVGHRCIEFILTRLVAGLLVVTPIYLAALFLSKVASSLMDLVEPLSKMLPEWMPGAHALSLLMVSFLCFAIGLAVSTSMGRSIWEQMENALFQKLPGYSLLRSLTQRMAGRTQEEVWRPALAEIEAGLVPGFIIEELADGRFTVYVPSVPTPFAGSVYILTANRVHPLNVSFTQAVKAVSRWGFGCRDLVAAMQDSKQPGLARGGTSLT
jgi:uncharacterized membrane protein